MTLEQYTCELFGCCVEDLFTPKRFREIVNSRQVCMWMMHKYSSSTLRYIGDYFNRNHATVVHSIITVNNLCATDRQFKAKVDKICDRHAELEIPLTLSLEIYSGCKVENDELIIV